MKSRKYFVGGRADWMSDVGWERGIRDRLSNWEDGGRQVWVKLGIQFKHIESEVPRGIPEMSRGGNTSLELRREV